MMEGDGRGRTEVAAGTEAETRRKADASAVEEQSGWSSYVSVGVEGWPGAQAGRYPIGRGRSHTDAGWR